jgi:hypothetical protein
MSSRDPLLEFVNAAGCQVMACAQTGLRPPDIYVKAKEGRRRKLVRRGPVSDYLREPHAFEVITSETWSASSQPSDSVAVGGGAHVLQGWLKVLGLTSPKIDLSFADSSEVTFSLGRVTSMRVEPSEIDQVLEILTLDAIPPKSVEMGFVHVAYEYLFTTSLDMRRIDGRAFSTSAEADFNDVVGGSVHAECEHKGQAAITFTAQNDGPVAFAYRAGSLTRGDRDQWYFEPLIRLKGSDVIGDPAAPPDDQHYVPFAGEIIDVVD